MEGHKCGGAVQFYAAQKKDSQARIKRLLPSSVSSPDRSPQPRKGIFRNSLPSAPLGNMRKIMRRIIYYDWHMYSPRPIRFSSHWCASYSKYRGFLAGGISNASSPRPFLDRGSAAKTLIAQYRQLRRLSVRRSTTTALNVNTNVKLCCSFATKVFAINNARSYFLSRTSNFIDDEEFFCVVWPFRVEKHLLSVRNYSSFNLNDMTESECLSFWCDGCFPYKVSFLYVKDIRFCLT